MINEELQNFKTFRMTSFHQMADFHEVPSTSFEQNTLVSTNSILCK